MTATPRSMQDRRRPWWRCGPSAWATCSPRSRPCAPSPTPSRAPAPAGRPGRAGPAGPRLGHGRRGGPDRRARRAPAPVARRRASREPARPRPRQPRPAAGRRAAAAGRLHPPGGAGQLPGPPLAARRARGGPLVPAAGRERHRRRPGPARPGAAARPGAFTAAGATLVHPGAASPSRRWPPERFAEVARSELAAGRRVIVTGGPDEVDLANDVAARAGLPSSAVHAGQGGVLTIGRLVAAADRVVCGDTGVAHLATALRTPSVVLFGPTPRPVGPAPRPALAPAAVGRRPWRPQRPAPTPASWPSTSTRSPRPWPTSRRRPTPPRAGARPPAAVA